MKHVALAVVSLIVSSSAFAEVTTFQSANAAPKDVANKDLSKIVCEVDSTTGTRLGDRKVCHTLLEWKTLQQGHREDVEKAQQALTGLPVSH